MSTIGPIQAVIYGIVQGLTEFLPVSSTAHLRLFQAWLNPHIDQHGFTAFTAVIQLGTMAAVVLYFWRELVHVGPPWGRAAPGRVLARRRLQPSGVSISAAPAGESSTAVPGVPCRDFVVHPRAVPWARQRVRSTTRRRGPRSRDTTFGRRFPCARARGRSEVR